MTRILNEEELETTAQRSELCESATLPGDTLRSLIHGNRMLRELMKLQAEEKPKAGVSFNLNAQRAFSARRRREQLLKQIVALDAGSPGGEQG